MYCWNCGHKNPDANKFCGECGKAQVRPPVFVEGELPDDNIRTMNPRASVDRRSEPQDTQPTEPLLPLPGTGITPAPVRSTGTNPLVEEPRTVHETPVAVPPVSVAAEKHQERPRISGPSFLGLSDGPVSSDYLLEEDPDDRSMGRSYLLLGFLLLFGVLIYKQWGTVVAIGREIAHNNQPDTIAEAQPPKPSPAPAEEQGVPASNPDARPESDRNATDESATPPDKSNEEDAIKKETAPPEPKEPEAGPTKAAAATTPVYDDSQIELAQRYLQGRGVAQDCSRGISILRSAAAQPNPKAQIKLGALYATGHCVEQDRAEAYRWFAQAHELQPGNPWIDKNLNSLWSEMTQAERARAQR